MLMFYLQIYIIIIHHHSEIVWYNTPTNELCHRPLPILVCQLPDIFTLCLAALVVVIQVYPHHCSTKQADQHLCDVYPEHIYHGENQPNQGEEGESPPEDLIVGSTDVLLVDLALEFPRLLTLLIKVYPPSQPHQQSPSQILHNPKVYSSHHDDDLHGQEAFREQGEDQIQHHN